MKRLEDTVIAAVYCLHRSSIHMEGRFSFLIITTLFFRSSMPSLYNQQQIARNSEM